MPCDGTIWAQNPNPLCVHFSTGLLPAFVYNFLGYGVPLQSAVVDDSRHILYTLDGKSHVRVYDLGFQGKDLSHVKHVNVFALLAQDGNNNPEFGMRNGLVEAAAQHPAHWFERLYARSCRPTLLGAAKS